jgi:hypothetical protein
MTLPHLPTNLNPATAGKNLSGITQQAIPQFPKLPTIPGVASAQQVINSGEQFVAASKTTLKLIETAIPEEQIDKLIDQNKSIDGTVNFDKVKDELDKKSEAVNLTYEKIIDGLQPPSVSVTGLLAQLIPTIPVPNIPSPGEIREYINNLIEKKKIEQQQAIMKLQKQKAKLEETPFTARLDSKNNEQ